MKPIFTLALAFSFAIQFSFAQKTLPGSPAKFIPDPAALKAKAVLPPSASSAKEPCSSPTTIVCGVPLTNQDNIGFNQNRPDQDSLGSNFWTSNFSAADYENCVDYGPTAYDAPDRLYRFTLNNPETVLIRMSNLASNVDLDMFLLDNCSPANCIAYSTLAAGEEELIEWPLDAGTYYIAIDGYYGSQGYFDLSLEYDGGCIDPCLNPVLITCGQTKGFQNNLGSSGWTNKFNATAYYDCNINPFGNYTAPDRLYQFELDVTTEVTITLDILDQSQDLDMFLMYYCSPATCLDRGINDTIFPKELIIITLNPGIYYIIVDGWQGAQGFFNLTLECGGNGDCSNPANLACGQPLTAQTTTGQPNNFSANTYSACGIPSAAPYSAPDKLYKFTLNSAEEVNISMEVLTAGANLDMFLLSSCSPATCIDYSNKTTPFESIQKYLSAGTYYLLVDGYNGSQGNFNIQMSCNCSCIEPIDIGDLLSCESFEGFADNASVSPNSVRWNKWSGTTGDALAQGDASNKYLEMKGIGNPTPDVWFNLGSNTTGRYRLSFEMLVEPGKNGNYYVLHQAPNASGANANTAYRVLFNADGNGYVRLGLLNTNVATFKYPNGEWVDVVQIIDLGQDVAELWVDGEFVHSWKFSVGSNGSLLRLEALNFDADDASYAYRVDKICFRSKVNCNNPPAADPVCIENGTQANNSATANCNLYIEEEYQPCNTVCEYGGKFIYRSDNFSGSFDASDRAPWSVRSQPCVKQAYGNNLPLNLYADIYVFSRQDTKDIGISFNDNGNPNLRAFVFVCNSDQDENGTCEDGEVCWEVLPSGDVAINTCHNFYYVVITGTLGETYADLNIIPNGNCPTDPEIISCGSTVSGTVGSQQNYPPPIQFVSGSEPYLQCYNGFRDYTGKESFYKLVLTQPSKITVNLTASAPNPSPMGVFLFSFLCGGNCLGYAENTASNPSAMLSANLSEGIYYLVVDKGTDAGNNNFTLSLNCEPYSFVVTFDQFIGNDFGCPTDAATNPHLVKLLYSPTYVSTDYFEFYFRDVNGQLKGNPELNQYWHNSSLPLNFDLHTDDPVADMVKCSYVQGDTFYVFVHQTEEGKSTLKRYRPTFAPVTGGSVTDSLKFRPGGLSIITKLTEIDAINFLPEFSTITALPDADTRLMRFISGEPWRVEKVNGPAGWLTVTPQSSNVSQILSLVFQQNPSPKPRSVVLRFYTTEDPDLYQQFVLVTQQGRCEIPQPVNIVATNTNVCAGTTVTLSADVGTNFVDLYNYLWSTGSTETSISVTPNTNTTYSVTVTNKYCFITSEDAQAITTTPFPNAPVPAINASICQGQPNAQAVSVGAQPGGVQVFWYSQSTGGSPLLPNPSNAYTPVPQPTATTTYFAESIQNGCKSPSRTPVTLTVNPKPTFVTTDTLCSPSLLTYTIVTTISDGNTVTANPGFPVTFNPANGTYTISNIPRGTNVTLTVTNTGTTCNNTKLVLSPVCLCTAVNAPTTNSPQDYCPNETSPLLTASVGNGEMAEWYAGPNTPNTIGTGPIFPSSGPGLYWVQSRNTVTQCVSPRIAVQVILLPRPTFAVLDKTCSPNLTTYTVRFLTDAEFATAPPYAATNLGGGNFEITGIAANSPISIHLVDAVTNCFRDTLVTSAQCGCPPNIPKPTTNTPLVNPCEGASTVPPLTVMVPNGMLANWYRNGQLQIGSPNPTLQASVAGEYWAKTFNPSNQCESTDSTKVTLQYKPLPTIMELDNTKSCDASWQSYQVTLSSSTSNLTSVPNIAPGNNGNGTYTFLGIPIASPISITANANGCTQSIGVNPPICTCTTAPAAPQNPNNPAMCLGATIPLLSVTIVSPATETVDWYDTPSGGLPLVNPSPISTFYQPTTTAITEYYAQTRFIQNGCISARTKVTLRIDLPATSFAGVDATICAAQAFPLNGMLGGSAGTGTWSALGGTFSPSNGFSQAQTYTPPFNFQNGTITISLKAEPTQPSVCPSTTDKMLLTVSPAPTLTLLGEGECEPNLDFYSIKFNTDADAIEFTPDVSMIVFNPDGSYSYPHIPEGVAVTMKAIFVSTDCSHTITAPAKTCDCPTNISKPTWLGDKEICEGVTQYPTLEVGVPMGFTVDWYETEFGGMPIHNDATFENPPGPGEYWAEARNTTTICTSFQRTLVKLEVKPNPTANAGLDKESCPGSGSITITAVPSGPVDSYTWSNSQVGPSIQVPIQNATYYLTATLGDCQDRDTVNVTVLPGITAITFDQTNIRCNGGFDGSLTALPVGGDAPFKFAWSNGNTEATISGLSIGPPHMGTYTVTATNAQGCSGTASATISQPLPLAFASAPIVQDATNSLDNGSIQVNITGGTTPYQYQWLYLNNSPVSGQNSSLIDSIYADKYKVRVTDFNGCTFVSSPIEVLNIIDSMIGTSEVSLAYQIQVFPNPTTGKVYLRFNLPEQEDAQIEAYDMLGRLLVQERKRVAPSDVFEIDLSERASGIYLLKIRVDREVLTRKVSVKK